METFLISASYFVVFSLGYIIGKINSIPINVNIQNPVAQSINTEPAIEKPVSFITRAASETSNKGSFGSLRKIEIDDRKFITEVKTDSLEKKFDDLGKTTVAKDEGLSANVSKLASLKKSKED
jgi:hypothetical protein